MTNGMVMNGIKIIIWDYWRGDYALNDPWHDDDEWYCDGHWWSDRTWRWVPDEKEGDTNSSTRSLLPVRAKWNWYGKVLSV